MANRARAVAVTAQHFLPTDEHDARVKVRAAASVGHIRELTHELLVIGSVVAVLAGPSGGVDAGRAAEGVDAKPGVVGHCHEAPGLFLSSTCLYQRVLVEIRAVLHGIGKVAELAQRHKAHARQHAGENRLDLHDLVRVARGHDDRVRIHHAHVLPPKTR